MYSGIMLLLEHSWGIMVMTQEDIGRLTHLKYTTMCFLLVQILLGVCFLEGAQGLFIIIPLIFHTTHQ